MSRCYKVVVSRGDDEVESPFHMAGERVGRAVVTQIAFELCRLVRQSSGKPFGVFEQGSDAFLVTAERYRTNARQVMVRLVPVEGDADPSRSVWKTITQQRMVGEVGRFAFACQHL